MKQEAQHLNLAAIFQFFWPLAATNMLMSITSSIVNSSLSFQQNGIQALATFSVAYVVAVFLNSPVYSAQQTSIVLVKDKRTYHQVHGYLMMQALIMALLQLLIIFSPAGHFLFRSFIGVNADITRLSLISIAIWIPLTVLISWRGLFQGILIQHRKTRAISLATGIRIFAMLLILLLLPHFTQLHGALIAAISITFSIGIEVIMVFIASRQYYKALPGSTEKAVTFREFIAFTVPLSLSMLLWTAAGFLLNSIVAHSTDSEEALAIMAIAYGSLGWLFSAPAKTLLQCNLTLATDSAKRKLVLTFAKKLTFILTLLFALLLFPGIFDIMVNHVFKIPPELRPYLRWSMGIMLFYPAAIAIRNYIQGHLVRDKFTRIVSWASVGRLIFLIFIALITKAYPLSNGALEGIGLLVGSIYLENLILFLYKKHFIPTNHSHSSVPEQIA